MVMLCWNESFDETTIRERCNLNYKSILSHFAPDCGNTLSIYLLWLSWVFVAVHRLSLVAVHGRLTAVASLVAKHNFRHAGFSSRGLWVQ